MPLRADAERNRIRLLEAARTVFAERGLDVTMDEIARCAGVGVGTAYRRFRNRDEIIDALLSERVDELEHLAAEARAEPDAVRGLRRFLAGLAELQACDRGLKDLLQGDAGGRERMAAVRARLRAPIAELVERAVATGELRPGFAHTDLAVVTAMVAGAIDHTHDVDPDAWRRGLAVVLEGLCGDAPLPGRAPSEEQVEAFGRAR